MSPRPLQATPPDDAEISEELTGLPVQVEDPVTPPAAAIVPECEAWITDALIEDTRRVWSRAYGRIIAPQEAVEILVNVKRVAWAFMKAMRKE